MNAPSNFLFFIKTLGDFKPNANEKKIIHTNLDINSYSVHHENVIVAMLLDQNSLENRQKALAAIKAIRGGKEPVLDKGKKVRSFRSPNLTLKETKLEDFVDWKLAGTGRLYEPPLTIGVDMEILEEQAATGRGFRVPKVPCHQQPIERMVKMVTAASGRLKSQRTRHEEILLAIYYRKLESHGKYMI